METREGSPETFECGLDRFIRVYEISLGQKGWSSYGEGGRGMRSCRPTTSQNLRPRFDNTTRIREVFIY